MREEVEKEEVKEEVEMKEEDAALIAFYSSFKDLFEFFCLNTTIHGTIRLVCSSRNKMKTAFWTLLFLASFAMLYWQFALLFNQYWAYPVHLSMSVHSAPEMFPAVTLCNLNPYRVNRVRQNMAELDKLARAKIYDLYGFNISIKDLDEDASFGLEEQSNGRPSEGNSSSFRLDQNITPVTMGDKVGFRLCNATGGECYNKVYFSGVDAIREWYRFHYMNIMSQIPPIIDVSYEDNQIGDLIYACQYNGEPCKTSDSEHFHHPVYGNCYTYNKNGKDDFWKAYKPGIVYGLSLILKVEQKDHIPLLSTSAGVRVMIHNHNQTSFMEHEGFDIRPGIESTIGIKQNQLTRLGGVYGECTHKGKDVHIKLIYNSTYTLQTCLHSCFQHQMIKDCGCGYYYYPLPPGAEYCDYNKHPAWGHCYYLLEERLAYHNLSCFKECPKLCKETWYKLSAGYAKWPSAKSEAWLHRALQEHSSYNTTGNRKDIAKVNIFYERLDYISWDEHIDCNVSELMSNMGSQWSLWFGSSVLSVFEMFELLIDITILTLIFFYRRLTAQKKLKMSQPPTISSVTLTLEKYRFVEEGLASNRVIENPYAKDGNDSFVQTDELPPYSKYKYQVPELYSSVVLHGFKHQKEHCVDKGPNS